MRKHIKSLAGKPSFMGLAFVASITPAIAGDWQVEQLTQFDRKLTAPATLTISDDEKVRGFSGCNQFIGAIVVERGVERIQVFGSTKKYCTDSGRRQQEAAMMEALRQTREMRLDTGRLLFHNADGTMLMSMSRR